MTVLPGAWCCQGSGPVWQQRLSAGQWHGNEWEGQQVVVPVQLRQRVHKARQRKLCLPRVVVKGNLRSIRPQMHTPTGIPEGQGLFAGWDVKAHEQLAHGVDVENVRHIGEASGFTELALTCRQKQKMDNYIWVANSGKHFYSSKVRQKIFKYSLLKNTSDIYCLNSPSKIITSQKTDNLRNWYEWDQTFPDWYLSVRWLPGVTCR